MAIRTAIRPMTRRPVCSGMAPMILEPGLAWPPPARAMVDSRFVARRDYRLADIAPAFGMPAFEDGQEDRAMG